VAGLRLAPHNVRSTIRFRRRILHRRGFGFIRGSVGRLVWLFLRTWTLVVVLHRVWHSPKVRYRRAIYQRLCRQNYVTYTEDVVLSY